MTVVPTTPASVEARERALEVLLSDELEPIIELVLLQVDDDTYEARAHDGRARFHRELDGPGWRFTVDEVDGRNPVEDQSADRFAGVEVERAALYPNRTVNSYPYAYDNTAQLFDHASAPDLCVIHSAAHNWEDQGGHRGEHGSLDVVQSRAPFVISGAGVRAEGVVDRHCRLIDVAPTVLALLGLEPGRGVAQNGTSRDDAFLKRQDGEPQLDVIDAAARPPRHVVGFLFDGMNPNVMHELVAAGEAPNLARLIAQGTSFAHGAMASLPSVTLANHTGILTGCFPGHHKILHNAWFDRARGEQVITNSPLTWANSMQWLDPEVDTIHSAVKRSRPDAVTISINEPCDSYADFSTFDLIRRGEQVDRPPGPDELPHSTERFVRPSKDYRWSSRTDHTAVDQFEGIWSGNYRGTEWPIPTFSWVNFTLTDAAFHEGGPHSEMARASVHDTDARLGRVLAAVESAGVWDQTAFFVVADHGMEESNPEVRGDWDVVLREAGIRSRDEAYGFLYLEG